jgi:hypothetical protein
MRFLHRDLVTEKRIFANIPDAPLGDSNRNRISLAS